MYQAKTEVFLFLSLPIFIFLSLHLAMASWLAACLPSDIYSTVQLYHCTVHHITSIPRGCGSVTGGRKGKKRPDQTRVYIQYVSVRYIVPGNVLI